jgi:penicillin-binding protein 2
LGRPTGIDLPNESSGFVPQPDSGIQRLAEAQALAIGQNRLTVTPLQMARVMAALANGGLLVQPHVLNSISSGDDLPAAEQEPQAHLTPQPIEGLHRKTLDILRDSLARVVADPIGSAHETVFLDHIAIAGKTGTAQAGADLPDHAWFAAYCPADAPKVAIVVALEHAGDGSLAAGPVARRLIERMSELGYFRK